MKLFIDCEFNGYQGALISMALVPEMGEPFYHVLNTDGVKIDPWVRENVMDRLIYNHRGDYPISRTSFAGALQKYLSQWTEVTIVADWPDDIKYFCDSLITGPGEAINTPYLNFEIRRLDINSDVPHNALSDAYAIRKAYRDCGYADKPSDEQIVIMLDVLEEAKKKAIEERDIAVGMLAEWVNAVENNGTGWDDWDEHYKDAAFRKNPIRNLLDKAINRKIEE